MASQLNLTAASNQSGTSELITAVHPAAIVAQANKNVLRTLPQISKGDAFVLNHMVDQIVPGFNGSALSANYYGFVTGGVLPIAEAADNIVTAYDQNAAVHLPQHTVCTTVDYAAVHMLLQLLQFEDENGNSLNSLESKTKEAILIKWDGTFTTGATASNIMGLLCGRDAILSQRLQESAHHPTATVGDIGLLEACRLAGIDHLQILTTEGHSSLYKAASVVGIGRSMVKDVALKSQRGIMDWQLLESELQKARTASIVAVSAGDVNTGRFSTNGYGDMEKLAALCKKYRAWLHVDGAFGLFARALPNTPEFQTLREHSAGLELADSITGDCHKLLNVPYDCGIFFTRDVANLTAVLKNPNAPYLAAGGGDGIPSPLNINLANSRRFRALPVYAVLLSLGSSGLADMFARQVRLARNIASYLSAHSAYELLPESAASREKKIDAIHMIVLFRARSPTLNVDLVQRLNRSGKIYVSGTIWDEKPAVRIAVSTWRVDVDRDFEVVKEVLKEVILAGPE